MNNSLIRLLVKLVLSLIIRISWKRFLGRTPKNSQWMKAYDAYMEKNKRLYTFFFENFAPQKKTYAAHL